MKTSITAFICFFYLLASTILSGEENTLTLKLKETHEVGRKDLLFASIESVCEDNEENFYVLDRKNHAVTKFSPGCEHLVTFGRKGQGPGDFAYPYSLTFTPEGNIVVAEEMGILSFFKTDGTFIRRIYLSGRLAPNYIGGDRFYAWIWEPDHKKQVLLDKDNNILESYFIVPRTSFSVSAPDETGRHVMFTYSPDAYAPMLTFSYFRGLSIVGMSSIYEILVLDGKGKPIQKIIRDIPPGKIKKNDRKYFSNNIKSFAETRGWPKGVIKKLTSLIPKKKTYFNRILLSSTHVYVFRIKEDLSDKRPIIPVDVFSLSGEFMGTTSISAIPIYMSDRYMYFVRSDIDDNLYLVKAEYEY